MKTVAVKVPGVQLRPGVVEDAPLLMDLIRELAAYERLSDAVTGTAEELAATLFGPQPAAEVIIAEEFGIPVGFALFFRSYSTFRTKPGMYLEDLYIRPEARSKGIGRALLAFLASIAQERGYGRFEWSVLDWNDPAIRVYNSIGAEPLAGWTVQRLEGERLAALGRRFDDEYRL